MDSVRVISSSEIRLNGLKNPFLNDNSMEMDPAQTITECNNFGSSSFQTDTFVEHNVPGQHNASTEHSKLTDPASLRQSVMLGRHPHREQRPRFDPIRGQVN